VRLGRVREVARAAQDADEDPLGGEVAVDDGGGEQAGKSETVGDALDEDAGGAEGGRGDELAGVEVDDDADDEVEDRDERLAHDDGLGVVALVAHLGGDREAVGRRRGRRRRQSS